jgi:tRNA dimethylallyltransferase
MPLTGKPLVVILGATATGKTSLAIEVARALQGEIISADSRQIYRYMDIGTAKATPDQQRQAIHHLLDIVNPDENLTAAEYQALAYQTIQAIHQRGKLPLLVGGTGQYITTVVEGWTIPRISPHPELRAELEAFANTHGKDALHQRLAALDPLYAAKTHPNNLRRVIRALEVCLLSHSTMTEQQQRQPPPYRLYTIGLHLDRETLYARADQRVDDMLHAGFLQEVQNLLNRGYQRNLSSLSGVGYTELIAHLLDNVPLADAIQRTKFSTHDFIRRQEVWFRGHDHNILWHNGTQLDIGVLLQTLTRWLEE